MPRIAKLLAVACCWLAACGSQAAPSFESIQIGNVVFSIPASFTSQDEDGTLVASPHDNEGIVLRVSVITIRKDGAPSPNAGLESAKRIAKESNAQLFKKGDISWYEEKGTAADEAPGSEMHYWYVGFRSHLVVISCFIDASQTASPAAKAIPTQVLALIHSMKAAKGA